MVGLTRRGALAAGLAAGAAPIAAQATTTGGIRPFPLDRVRLTGGPLLEAAKVNAKRLRQLDPDRLLHMFRVTAGLPTAADPLRGWEAPANELRGHFVGHWLSAAAMCMAGMDDERLRRRADMVMQGLQACQAAHGDGYLSAFPRELFDRLGRREKVWAPFYTLHKVLAGLIDMHVHVGDPRALPMARGLADWTDRWTAQFDDAHMQSILDTEFGGMGEALWDLQGLTGEPRYGAVARRFEKRKFLEPLAQRQDQLKGLHANTHIPQVIAAARRAELTGDATSREIADFFWTDVTEFRCFATGGTSSEEEWRGERGRLSGELGAYTHECCCTHNMLKLTRKRFGWSGDVRAADYYERALYNGILGTHHPRTGMMMYYTPMASGFWKMFSAGDDGFWCCDGTGVESFAKLGDSLYFEDGDSLYVNLYAASELDWPEKGVRLEQVTNFPEEPRTTLRIHADRPTAFALRLRIPSWADPGSVRLDDRPLPVELVKGGYLVLDRVWKDGDAVVLDLPMALRFEPMADDPGLRSIHYGPLVLAGKLGVDGLPATHPYAEPTKPREVPEFKAEPVAAPVLDDPLNNYGPGTPSEMISQLAGVWIEPVRGETLMFRAGDTPLVPFYRLQGQRYAVYWKVSSGTATQLRQPSG